ncbi:MAG: hypothetical protein ACQETE_12530 [Bacteroidota bacterium]
MDATLQTTKQIKPKILLVKAGVRYWEDASVNGINDTDGDLIPFKDGDSWCPEIDIDTGQILYWPEGTEADIHYKIADRCECELLDENGTHITGRSGYVPNILSPGGRGYGDYIIMKVDKNGFIDRWKQDISDWEDIV